MRLFGRLLGAAAVLSMVAGAALAVHPTTTGTEKRFQEQGLRSGILIQKNNTATAAGGAATLNGGSGIVTSESLTTAAGSVYTLTLTNSVAEATDIVLWSVDNGTNTQGAVAPQRVRPAAGSIVFVVKNLAEGAVGTGAAFLGTIKVNFVIVKQSVLGSD